MKIKDKILSETSEEVKQRVRDTANKLVMKELKKNFYCGDEVDYDDKCLEQCDRCVDATGVDYGYLEEAAVINYKKLYEGEPLTQDVPIDAFIDGAKWEQERSYSETIELIQFLSMNEDFNGYGSVSKETAQYFLKQFKKK